MGRSGEADSEVVYLTAFFCQIPARGRWFAEQAAPLLPLQTVSDEYLPKIIWE